MKEYDQALDYITKVWDISEAKYGANSESCAFALVESAKIHALTGKMNAAIENLNRAIGTFFFYINKYIKIYW